MHRDIYVNRNISGMDVHPYDRPYLAAFVYADCKPIRAAMFQAGADVSSRAMSTRFCIIIRAGQCGKNRNRVDHLTRVARVRPKV